MPKDHAIFYELYTIESDQVQGGDAGHAGHPNRRSWTAMQTHRVEPFSKARSSRHAEKPAAGSGLSIATVSPFEQPQRATKPKRASQAFPLPRKRVKALARPDFERDGDRVAECRICATARRSRNRLANHI